nr:flippase [Patescibacteria group bacterium]MBU1663581.1 flippase [Patescibacteria group bacterium]MBU1933888.1 flippase [Patescibacteria group bacterium]MBU2007838.1 flippase [Patescibacteria group bacterium]MBU2233809.1 flippase [Patescibacteria group bacterium]
MSEKITNIAKNTSYFTLALILQKVISFTYFVLIARAIGPADLGKYYFAISFTSIFGIFIDIGQSTVLTREVAKRPDDAEKLFSSVFLIKLPLAILSMLAVFSIINFSSYPDITRQLVYLSIFCMILDSFTLTFFSVSRGFHNLKYESISSVIFQLIVFIVVLTVLKFNLGLVWLMMSLVLASLYNFIFSFYILKKKWKLKINWRPDKILIKNILLISLPFAVYAIFQRVYMYFDSVLLSLLAGDHQVGIYQIPFKIIFALQFLPLAFIASLFPALSSYWQNNREQLAITFERAVKYLIIISLPVSIGGIILADKIMVIFKSDYSDAILPLQITMAAVIFMFLNFPAGSLLNACDRQKINTINMGIILIASVILNLILIPRYQAIGASLTVLLTNLLMFILSMSVVSQITKYDYKKIIVMLIKSLLAVAVMGAVGYYLKNQVNFILTVILSAVSYFIALYIFKGFSKQDVESIYKSFNKNKVS